MKSSTNRVLVMGSKVIGNARDAESIANASFVFGPVRDVDGGYAHGR